MVTLEEFLALFPSFKNNSDLVEKILSLGRYQSFHKDGFLYLEGDACPGIAFVLSGEIRVFKSANGGRELTLYEIFPGETCILNASCILSKQNYPANAMGLIDGTMIYLGEENFRSLVDEHEQMRAFIFKYFSNRYTEIIELIEAVAFHKMDDRIIEHLISKATDNKLETTHQKIANELGTSREVVSRLLKEMVRKGMVSVSRNRIELHDSIYT